MNTGEITRTLGPTKMSEKETARFMQVGANFYN